LLQKPPDECGHSCHCCLLGCCWLIVAALLPSCCFLLLVDCFFGHCTHIFLSTNKLLPLLAFYVTVAFLISDGLLLPLLPLFLLLFQLPPDDCCIFCCHQLINANLGCHWLIIAILSLLVERCCFCQCCYFSFCCRGSLLFFLHMVDCCCFAALPLCLAPLLEQLGLGAATSPCIQMCRVASGCKGRWQLYASHMLIVIFKFLTLAPISYSCGYATVPA